MSQNRKKPEKQTKAKELDSSGLFLFCLQEVHYLTLHNGVKFYFKKYIVGETGRLTYLTTPGVKLLKQSSIPTDVKIYILVEWWTKKLKSSTQCSQGCRCPCPLMSPPGQRAHSVRVLLVPHKPWVASSSSEVPWLWGLRPSSPSPSFWKGPFLSQEWENMPVSPRQAKVLCHLWECKCCRQPRFGLAGRSPPPQATLIGVFLSDQEVWCGQNKRKYS